MPPHHHPEHLPTFTSPSSSSRAHKATALPSMTVAGSKTSIPSYADDCAPPPSSSKVVKLTARGLVKPVGLDEQLSLLRNRLFEPLRGAPLFKGIPPPSGAILHGPPGTGKTMLAKFAAAQARVSFIYLKASEVNDKYLGQSEKWVVIARPVARHTGLACPLTLFLCSPLLGKMQKVFDQAKLSAPAVIMVDEVDCIFPSRSEGSVHHQSILAQLLVELDQAQAHNVAFIATTNRLDAIDPALLRRLTLRLNVPKPDLHARRAIFVEALAKYSNKLSARQIDMLASATSGCSRSDLVDMVQDAVCNLAASMRDAAIPSRQRRPQTRRPLTYRHFTLPSATHTHKLIHQHRPKHRGKGRQQRRKDQTACNMIAVEE
ncbi:hypothetical protein V8E36_003507 [Tilletia maclaganii]